MEVLRIKVMSSSQRLLNAEQKTAACASVQLYVCSCIAKYACILALQKDDQDGIFAILSTILHLGNVLFGIRQVRRTFQGSFLIDSLIQEET